jgi:hypothetical protein
MSHTQGKVDSLEQRVCPKTKRPAHLGRAAKRGVERAEVEPAVGFEPTACGLRIRLSSFGLVRHYPPLCSNPGILPVVVRLDSPVFAPIGIRIGIKWHRCAGASEQA